MLIKNNIIEIKTEDVETSAQAKETIVCEYENEEIKIAFNSEYLKELLEKTGTEKTIILLKKLNSFLKKLILNFLLIIKVINISYIPSKTKTI